MSMPILKRASNSNRFRKTQCKFSKPPWYTNRAWLTISEQLLKEKNIKSSVQLQEEKVAAICVSKVDIHDVKAGDLIAYSLSFGPQGGGFLGISTVTSDIEILLLTHNWFYSGGFSLSSRCRSQDQAWVESSGQLSLPYNSYSSS